MFHYLHTKVSFQHKILDSCPASYSTKFPHVFENWADCHSPLCLHGWLCLPKGKTLHFPSIAFLRSPLICNYHAVLHHVPPGLMLSSSLINRASTHKPSYHLQCYEKMKWYTNQPRVHQNFSLQFCLNCFLPILHQS